MRKPPKWIWTGEAQVFEMHPLRVGSGFWNPFSTQIMGSLDEEYEVGDAIEDYLKKRPINGLLWYESRTGELHIEWQDWGD